jgi:hypothetical protein
MVHSVASLVTLVASTYCARCLPSALCAYPPFPSAVRADDRDYPPGAGAGEESPLSSSRNCRFNSSEKGGRPSITLLRSATSRIRSTRSASSRSHGLDCSRLGPLPKFVIYVLYHFPANRANGGLLRFARTPEQEACGTGLTGWEVSGRATRRETPGRDRCAGTVVNDRRDRKGSRPFS